MVEFGNMISRYLNLLFNDPQLDTLGINQEAKLDDLILWKLTTCLLVYLNNVR